MAQESDPRERPESDRQARWLPGALLIVIGFVVLVGQWTRPDLLGTLVLLSIGLIFLAVGLARREAGLFIPAGILLGLGLGVYLIQGPLAHLEGEAEGAVVLLSFAAGWFLIVPLSALYAPRPYWWAAIPGAVLGLIGVSLMRGQEALEALGNVLSVAFPAALIIIGLWLIVSRLRDSQS